VHMDDTVPPDSSLFVRLRRLSIPIMLTNLLQMTYNLVDAWYLGKLGAAAVSAPAMSFSFIMFLAVFGIGFSMAGTTLVSQSHGAGKPDRVNFYASQTVTIVGVIGIFVGIIGFVLAAPLLRLLQAPAEAFEYARIYMRIVFAGIPVMFFFFIMQALMHGLGDSMTPLKIQVVTVVLNVILDPLFIFGFGPLPAMEVAGAATATVISRSIAAVLALMVLLKGRRGMKIERRYLRPERAAIGLSKATAALVGQELGAERPEGARRVVRLSVLSMLVFIVPAMTFTFFYGNTLVRFFVDDPEVIGHGTLLFRIVSVSVVPFTLFTVINGAFEGGGVTRPVMVLNIFRLWGLRVPLAMVLSTRPALGANGIWIAMFLSNIVTATLGFLWLRRGSWLRRLALVQQ
jgi:Na+-driven multidrug efflux pump